MRAERLRDNGSESSHVCLNNEKKQEKKSSSHRPIDYAAGKMGFQWLATTYLKPLKQLTSDLFLPQEKVALGMAETDISIGLGRPSICCDVIASGGFFLL